MENWGKKQWLIVGGCVLAAFALVFAYARAAEAADKGGPEERPLIPGLSVIKGATWTGIYIGADAGLNVLDAAAARSRETVKEKKLIEGSDPPAYTYEFNAPDSILNADSLGGKDWTYGVRGGLDFQFQNSPFVVGILGGYGWGSVAGSASFAEKPDMALIKAAAFSIEPTWHVGGRVGVVLYNKALVYVGGAWTQAEAAGTVTVATVTTPTKLSASQTVDGYMILTGMEAAIAPMWTIGLEYSYSRFEAVNFVGSVIDADRGPDARHSLAVEPDIHAFKVRLNFRPFSN